MKVNLKQLLAGLDNAADIEAHIKQVLEENGYKIFIDDGEGNRYVPKARLDSKISELAKANEAYAELQSQYNELEKQQNNDNSETSNKVDELNASIAQYQQKIQDMILQNALNSIKDEFKARDVADLKAFLDMSKVTISEDGVVEGLKEQVEQLKENKAYLFESVVENKPEGIGSLLARTGTPGKPANVSSFGSKTTHAGDFGKQLAGKDKEQSTQVDSNYFFKKDN